MHKSLSCLLYKNGESSPGSEYRRKNHVLKFNKSEKPTDKEMRISSNRFSSVHACLVQHIGTTTVYLFMLFAESIQNQNVQKIERCVGKLMCYARVYGIELFGFQ